MANPEVLLRQVPLFRSLPAEECRRIAGLMRLRTIRKGEVLFRKGDEGTALYLIVAGSLKIVRQSRTGDEVILALLGSGDFCGEMALLDGFPRSADAVAAEETRLLVLGRQDFLSYVMNNEPAVRAILAALSARLRRADDFLEDIFFLKVPARLAKKLLELAGTSGKDGTVRVSQQELASMIGASRESVNKALRSLRQRGMVTVRGSVLELSDPEGLRRLIR